ncbi:hypothetical protein B0H11DRAFT_39224 [Mycena galericulata]|nr:hypothetical protein B0H11DRAFT_39224 [Mycena galericulata]
MSCLFDDYPGAQSPRWNPQPYDSPESYHMYSCGARVGESASTSGFSAFSPSYNYADSPDMLAFDETPLSPSSSSSSCSDAPITPYYQAPPLPNTGILYTGLDGAAAREYCGSPPRAEPYTYEGWEDPDVTQTYRTAAAESSLRSSALYTEYDHAAALRACDDAIAQLQSFDTSPTACVAPDAPNYATYVCSSFPPVTSSAVSPPHAHEYPCSYPPNLCLSPALLSCPPPLKLHQPQPRRSIPVVSLSALACDSSEPTARDTSPALSPLELQFSASQSVGMTSYSGLLSSADSLPIAAYQPCCSCPDCTPAYSIL